MLSRESQPNNVLWMIRQIFISRQNVYYICLGSKAMIQQILIWALNVFIYFFFRSYNAPGRADARYCMVTSCLYWLDYYLNSGKDPQNCTFERSVWEADPSQDRCTEYDWTVQGIAAIYLLFSNLLLVNLVIAKFRWGVI